MDDCTHEMVLTDADSRTVCERCALVLCPSGAHTLGCRCALNGVPWLPGVPDPRDAELTRLREDKATLRAALEWYANEGNYHRQRAEKTCCAPDTSCAACSHLYEIPVSTDEGARARAALARCTP
jgi:hypothetical protein